MIHPSCTEGREPCTYAMKAYIGRIQKEEKDISVTYLCNEGSRIQGGERYIRRCKDCQCNQPVVVLYGTFAHE
jgi:hypothetical protein